MTNSEKWKLKHQMIVQSIRNKGDFDLDKINREIEEMEQEKNAE